jgi:hypothetical protein
MSPASCATVRSAQGRCICQVAILEGVCHTPIVQDCRRGDAHIVGYYASSTDVRTRGLRASGRGYEGGSYPRELRFNGVLRSS